MNLFLKSRNILRLFGCLGLGIWLVLSPAAHADNSLLLTARYLKTVHDQVQKIWKPQHIKLMDLHLRSATFTLWIDAKGKLLKTKLSHSSGNKLFDASLAKTIQKANPFPPPSKAIQNFVSKDGIDIVFRRRVFRKKLLPLTRKYRDTTQVPNWQPQITKTKAKTKKKAKK